MYGEHNVIYSLNAIYQKPKRQQALSHAMTAFEFRGVTAVFGTENWLGNLFSPSISHLLGLPKLGQPVSTKGKKIKKKVLPCSTRFHSQYDRSQPKPAVCSALCRSFPWTFDLIVFVSIYSNLFVCICLHLLHFVFAGQLIWMISISYSQLQNIIIIIITLMVIMWTLSSSFFYLYGLMLVLLNILTSSYQSWKFYILPPHNKERVLVLVVDSSLCLPGQLSHQPWLYLPC